MQTAGADGVLTLGALEAGKYALAAGEYRLKVTGTNAGRYDLNVSVGGGRGEVLDLSPGTAVDLSNATRILRRDLIIGGPGKDVLSGGSGEEWIFGGPDNDVLSGGLDRQASDLIFGEGGDDIFQIIPDGLPFIKGTQRTLIPTLSDRFDGGDGTDQVLFLGGDLDRLGQPVPDHVAIRYNTKIHRYEFTSLIWDIANREFVREPDGRFAQQYQFYQPRNIERTVIDTRAGDDEVHGDPGLPISRDASRVGPRTGRPRAGRSDLGAHRSGAGPATTASSAAPTTTRSMEVPGWMSFSAAGRRPDHGR